MSNKKHYKVIVGHGFSIANETDWDPMTDYSPGIWGISSQKATLKYAKQYLDNGDTLEVTTYGNPQYAALGNKFIKALGLKQELFPEPAPLPKTVNAGNLKIGTLADLKRHLTPDTKVRVINYTSNGEVARDTFVKKLQTNAVVLDKNGGNSWLEFGKASEWAFDTRGATKYFVSSFSGSTEPQKSTRLEWIYD